MTPKIIADGLLNLLVRRYMGPFRRRRKWLERTQWLEKEQLEQIQLGRLKKVVRYAFLNVPFYKKMMVQKGIRVDDIRTLKDIEKFPILTKRMVIEAGDSIVSRKFCKSLLRKAYTGGTTGAPMTIWRSVSAIGNEHAFVRRQFDWAGVHMGDRCAYLTGRVVVKPDQTSGRLYRYDPFMKELILSTYHLSPGVAANYAQTMKKYKVKAVVGYPSSVYLLARACLESSVDLRLKAALTSSETLTASMKDVIGKAFGCQVFDFYGSAERVCYIFSCGHDNYHILPEYGLTELISVNNGESNTYRVVSTGFWNMAMPLIRYDSEDIVKVSGLTCRCGRHFPVIDEIAGRNGDVVQTPSGRQFGTAILTHLLYGTDHIVESQIVQDSADHLIIKYVPSSKFSEKDMEDFRGLIVKHLPKELNVDYQRVAKVERTKSGKIRPVVSVFGEAS